MTKSDMMVVARKDERVITGEMRTRAAGERIKTQQQAADLEQKQTHQAFP